MLKESKIPQKTICSLQSKTELVGVLAFFTVKEVSEALRVSRDTIYRLMDSRKLPFHLIGGCKRIALDDLKEYIQESKVQAHK